MRFVDALNAVLRRWGVPHLLGVGRWGWPDQPQCGGSLRQAANYFIGLLNYSIDKNILVAYIDT
jgi:hypothetical protein